MNWVDNIPAWTIHLTFLMYWPSAIVCAVSYTVRATSDIRKDLKCKNDEKRTVYIPTITVGTLVGYTLLTFVPLVNIFAAVFDAAPSIIKKFLEWCFEALDIPIIPNRKKINGTDTDKK